MTRSFATTSLVIVVLGAGAFIAALLAFGWWGFLVWIFVAPALAHSSTEETVTQRTPTQVRVTSTGVLIEAGANKTARMWSGECCLTGALFNGEQLILEFKDRERLKLDVPDQLLERDLA